MAGVLNVTQHVADDSCLYFETYIYRTVNDSAVAQDVKSAAVAGLNYYLGLDGNVSAQQIMADVRSATSPAFDLHMLSACLQPISLPTTTHNHAVL